MLNLVKGNLMNSKGPQIDPCGTNERNSTEVYLPLVPTCKGWHSKWVKN